MGKLVAAVLVGAVAGAISRGRGKTQAVRVLDVLALGPFLIWAASAPGRGRFILAASGAATIVFNGLNWLENRARGDGGGPASVVR